MGFVARKDVLALHDKGMCDVIIAPAEDMELEHGKAALFAPRVDPSSPLARACR